MFGYKLIKVPIKLQGTKKEMKLATGHNTIDNDFFIFITDKKTGITCRINMDEEYYNNFFYMGKFTLKQKVAGDIQNVLDAADERAKGVGLFP